MCPSFDFHLNIGPSRVKDRQRSYAVAQAKLDCEPKYTAVGSTCQAAQRPQKEEGWRQTANLRCV